MSKTEAALPNLAIFASGRGSNAEAIIRRFEQEEDLRVSLVLSNNPGAGVLDIAHKNNISIYVTGHSEFYGPSSVLPVLEEHAIDWIALAGFLWLVPQVLIQAYPGRIVNIHPALLPKYGGKGMYGDRVHQAVLVSGETQSGITIHYADGEYDHGKIIFQASLLIPENATVDILKNKILNLEHTFYPEILIDLIRK